MFQTEIRASRPTLVTSPTANSNPLFDMNAHETCIRQPMITCEPFPCAVSAPIGVQQSLLIHAFPLPAPRK